MYDTIIVGGGPAGLSAAIHLPWHNRKALVVDRRSGPLSSDVVATKRHAALGTISRLVALYALAQWANKVLLLLTSCAFVICYALELWVVWRVIQELPPQPGMGFRFAPAASPESPEALRSAGPARGIFLIPEDLGAPGQLQRPVPLEIEEHESRARIHGEVAERVEHAVAHVVGNSKRPLIDNLDEARRPSAV